MHLKTIAAIILLTSAIWSFGACASEETEAIQQIQQAINDSGGEWIAGETTLSGFTQETRDRLPLSAEIPPPTCAKLHTPSMRVLSYEESFDWRDHNGVTPVRWQGMCGSCWAFSAVATVESAFLVYADRDLDLSEQFLVSDCCRGAGDCDGGWMDWSFDVVKAVGLPSEACYPYEAKDSECEPCDGWEDTAYKILDYNYVEPSINDFKYALTECGPLSVVVHVPDDWYYYRSGIYSPVTTVGWANHAVLLTGWDDNDGCWFIKNSWGSGWGEQGYARVKYGDLEKYNYAYAITGIVDHGSAPDIEGWMKPVSATASSEYSDSHPATNAIDNNTGTHWFSERRDPYSSIEFNLGELVTIGKVRVMLFRDDVPITLDIFTSLDGVEWVCGAEQVLVNTCSEYVEIPLTSQSCQYVRMNQTDVGRIYGTCTEFDVWACGEEAEPPRSTIEITYPDRVQSIDIDSVVMSMTFLRNGTAVWSWWNA